MTLLIVAVSLLSCILGYKIYQKGLKDGLSLLKTEKLSEDPLIKIPKIPKKVVVDREEELENEIFNLCGSGEEHKIKKLQDELKSLRK